MQLTSSEVQRARVGRLHYLGSIAVRHGGAPQNARLAALAEALDRELRRHESDAEASEAGMRLLGHLAATVGKVYRAMVMDGAWSQKHREALRKAVADHGMLPADRDAQKSLLERLAPSVDFIRKPDKGHQKHRSMGKPPRKKPKPLGAAQAADECVGACRPQLLSAAAGSDVGVGPRAHRTVGEWRRQSATPPTSAGTPSQVRRLLLGLVLDHLQDDLASRVRAAYDGAEAEQLERDESARA